MDSFSQINDDLTKDEKWFKYGFKSLKTETNPRNNGSTDRRGNIWLTKEREEKVRLALAKIANGKTNDISESEADAMATFWHEITHNRNDAGYVKTTELQRRYMELANEFTARKTLPEFYRALGAKDTPQKQFINNRSSTGYNGMVNNYDSIIKEAGLDANKVLSSVKHHLFTASYADQFEGLKQGLLDGGIKKLDGSKLKVSELDDLVAYCAKSSDIKQYMRTIGIIK